VQVASHAPDIPSKDDIRQWVERAVGVIDADPDSNVSVRIVDEQEMRTLNRDFRDQDKPTNVLSFPAGDIAGLPGSESPVLGDIVVCATVVAAEAAEQGKALGDHWGHMLVHGTLHLLGYDHMTELEAGEMEGHERQILADLGIADPYQGN
jgi:probable rRNA maturation factor